MAKWLDFTTRKGSVKERANAFERRIDTLAEEVSGRFARGNIALQARQVLTAAQLKKERDALYERA